MGLRRVPFAPAEWYHCYNRGVEGRKVFLNNKDYERFVESLYLSNDQDHTHRYNIKHRKHSEILTSSRGEPLVAIGAYCLMPNHFHILLKELAEKGISKFMHRAVTGYAMYFNIKHKHVGGLFVRPFRAKHISNDRYLRRVAEYIHLNPVELFERSWKLGRVNDLRQLNLRLNEYPHSSLPSFVNDRLEKVVLDSDAIELLRGNGAIAKTSDLLEERSVYYASLNPQGVALGI